MSSVCPYCGTNQIYTIDGQWYCRNCGDVPIVPKSIVGRLFS